MGRYVKNFINNLISLPFFFLRKDIKVQLQTEEVEFKHNNNMLYFSFITQTHVYVALFKM